MPSGQNWGGGRPGAWAVGGCDDAHPDLRTAGNRSRPAVPERKPTPPQEVCCRRGRLPRPKGQPRALEAAGDILSRLGPYHPECARSRKLSRIGPGSYLGWRPPGATGCRRLLPRPPLAAVQPECPWMPPGALLARCVVGPGQPPEPKGYPNVRAPRATAHLHVLSSCGQQPWAVFSLLFRPFSSWRPPGRAPRAESSGWRARLRAKVSSGGVAGWCVHASSGRSCWALAGSAGQG